MDVSCEPSDVGTVIIHACRRGKRGTVKEELGMWSHGWEVAELGFECGQYRPMPFTLYHRTLLPGIQNPPSFNPNILSPHKNVGDSYLWASVQAVLPAWISQVNFNFCFSLSFLSILWRYHPLTSSCHYSCWEVISAWSLISCQWSIFSL